MNRFGEPVPRRSRRPAAKGRTWTPEQWADILRCARVAKGEPSGLSKLSAGRALREYAQAVEDNV